MIKAIDSRALAGLRVYTGICLLFLWPYGSPAAFGVVGTIIAVITLLALTLGYLSRWSALAVWLLLVVAELSAPGSAGTASLFAGIVLLLAGLPASTQYSVDMAIGWVNQQARQFSFADAAIILATALVVAGIFTRDTDIRMAQILVIAPVFLFLLSGSTIWVWLSDRANVTTGTQLHIFYDQECGFCYKICLLFRTFLVLGKTPVSPAQSDSTAYRLMQEHDSWVVTEGTEIPTLHWNALLLLMRRSIVARPIGLLLTSLGMGIWGRPLYRAIAWSRGFLSKVTALLLPKRQPDKVARQFGRWLPILWLTVSSIALIAYITTKAPALPLVLKVLGIPTL